jgi:hypothetical protein
MTDKAQQRQIEALAARLGVQEHPPATAPQLWRVTVDNGDDTYDLAAVWSEATNQTTRVREDVPAIDDALAVGDTCVLVSTGSSPRTLHAWRAGGTCDNPHTIGSTATTDAALTDSWDRSAPPVGTDGVEVWIGLRPAYNYDGDELWYCDFRKFTWDSSGRLAAITVETRVVVDTPGVS